MMEDEIYGFHEKINSRRMSASSRDYSTKIQRAAVLGWAGIIVLKMKRQMVFKGIKFHKKAIRGVQLWVYDRCAQLKLNSRRIIARLFNQDQRAAVLGWAGIIVLKMKRQMVFKGIKFHKKAIRGVQPGGFTTVVRSCRWHESSSSSSSPPIISPERNRRWISLFIPLLKKKLTTRTSSVRECVVNAQC